MSFPAHFWVLSDCPFGQLSPLPFLLQSLFCFQLEKVLLLRAHVIRSGPSRQMDNPVIFHILLSITLVISAKFLILCKVTCSQVPRIRSWTSLECLYSAYHITVIQMWGYLLSFVARNRRTSLGNLNNIDESQGSINVKTEVTKFLLIRHEFEKILISMLEEMGLVQ